MSIATLYHLADQLFTQAPWDTLEETDLIRIVHPVTGESGYISIMGAIGQHYCLTLYIGDEALRRYNLMQSDDPADPGIPETDQIGLILETRQLQAAFGPRSELRKDELAEIKKLGRKYRGENWPMFRSFKPGCVPGPLDAEGVLWLSTAIEQFLAVFPTLVPGCTFRLTDGEFEMLTRQRDKGEWHSIWAEHDGRCHEWATPAPSEIMIEKVKRHTRLVDIDCHFQLLPAPIGRPESAVYPYLAITAEPKSGYILGMEMLSVEKQSYESLIASVPDVFLRQWEKAGIRPASIRVSTITSYSMLEIAAADLNTPMRRATHLAAIDQLMRELPF
ncbi:MAG: hypothetical protein ABI162_18435 [Luteolibacter sp.]